MMHSHKQAIAGLFLLITSTLGCTETIPADYMRLVWRRAIGPNILDLSDRSIRVHLKTIQYDVSSLQASLAGSSLRVRMLNPTTFRFLGYTFPYPPPNGQQRPFDCSFTLEPFETATENMAPMHLAVACTFRSELLCVPYERLIPFAVLTLQFEPFSLQMSAEIEISRTSEGINIRLIDLHQIDGDAIKMRLFANTALWAQCTLPDLLSPTIDCETRGHGFHVRNPFPSAIQALQSTSLEVPVRLISSSGLRRTRPVGTGTIDSIHSVWWGAKHPDAGSGFFDLSNSVGCLTPDGMLLVDYWYLHSRFFPINDYQSALFSMEQFLTTVVGPNDHIPGLKWPPKFWHIDADGGRVLNTCADSELIIAVAERDGAGWHDIARAGDAYPSDKSTQVGSAFGGGYHEGHAVVRISAKNGQGAVFLQNGVLRKYFGEGDLLPDGTVVQRLESAHAIGDGYLAVRGFDMRGRRFVTLVNRACQPEDTVFAGDALVNGLFAGTMEIARDGRGEVYLLGYLSEDQKKQTHAGVLKWNGATWIPLYLARRTDAGSIREIREGACGLAAGILFTGVVGRESRVLRAIDKSPETLVGHTDVVELLSVREAVLIDAQGKRALVWMEFTNGYRGMFEISVR